MPWVYTQQLYGARALGSLVPPKPSAKQMDLTGKGFKEEDKPSGEHILVCKVGTDCCVHPPLGSDEGPGFFPHMRPQIHAELSQYRLVLAGACRHWGPAGYAKVVHLDGGGQHQGQVQRPHLRRGRSPSHSPKETEGCLERTLPGVHPSTFGCFGIQLLHLSACVCCTPLPEEQ